MTGDLADEYGFKDIDGEFLGSLLVPLLVLTCCIVCSMPEFTCWHHISQLLVSFLFRDETSQFTFFTLCPDDDGL